jgi:isopentenyldiphosphate isomerase
MQTLTAPHLPPTDLYVKLRSYAQETPPAPARLVYVAGRRCGHATLAAYDALRNHPGVILQNDALHVGNGLTPGDRLDVLLTEIADTLRDADCLRGWRNECLDVTDEAGIRLSAIERSATRPLGLLTRAVHLNAWTPNGQLWVAKRALDKATDPGMWDTLVGGLATSQESLDLALLRECHEEAGLSPWDVQGRSPLRHVLRLRRRLPEGYQVEDLLVSRCVLNPRVHPHNCDGEVMAITTLSQEQVLTMIAAGEFTLEAALVILDDITQRA